MAQEEKRKNEKKLDTKHLTKTGLREIAFKNYFSQDFSVYLVKFTGRNETKTREKCRSQKETTGCFSTIFS